MVYNLKAYYSLNAKNEYDTLKESLKFICDFDLQELKDCKSQMTDLTNQWYQAIRISPDHSDDESANTHRSSISSIVR